MVNTKLEELGWPGSVLDTDAFSFIMNLFADAPQAVSGQSEISMCIDCSLFQAETDDNKKAHCRLNNTENLSSGSTIPDWCPVEIRKDAGNRIMAKQNERCEIRFCSFCEKPQSEVEKLIAGPGVYICNECIKACAEILED